jgi:hypothetical protein
MASDVGPMTAGSAAELDDAATACEFPRLIWELPDGEIRIVYPAAEPFMEISRERALSTGGLECDRAALPRDCHRHVD